MTAGQTETTGRHRPCNAIPGYRLTPSGDICLEITRENALGGSLTLLGKSTKIVYQTIMQ